MADHEWSMELTMDAASPEDMADRLRDLAWDVQRNATPGRRVFAGTSSSGVLDIKHDG